LDIVSEHAVSGIMRCLWGIDSRAEVVTPTRALSSLRVWHIASQMQAEGRVENGIWEVVVFVA
jgi:hypothetical protein